MEGFDTLDKLETLKLDENKITVVKGLKNLDSLKMLNLSTHLLIQNKIRLMILGISSNTRFPLSMFTLKHFWLNMHWNSWPSYKTWETQSAQETIEMI